MKVFNGSTSIVDKPLANIGRNHLDFGKGFYLTTLEAQAISWASRPLNQGKQKYKSDTHSAYGKFGNYAALRPAQAV